MLDLTGYTRLELERLVQVQDALIRDLEAELAKRDAMIAQAVGVILQAKSELERPAVTATSAAMDNGKYKACSAYLPAATGADSERKEQNENARRLSN